MIEICGIIGYISPNVTTPDLAVLRTVMSESRIRGKHASGLAWYDGQGIQSYIQPIPIDSLLEQFDLAQTVYKGKIAIIAHTRYSTSNIQFNQPIIGTSMAIAMNGVITQADPQHWEGLYRYKCITENDSELLLRAIEAGDDPTTTFPTSSMAAITLDNKGRLTAFRNRQRPLWEGTIGCGKVYASTYDILHRAEVINIQKLPPIGPGEELQRRWLHE